VGLPTTEIIGIHMVQIVTDKGLFEASPSLQDMEPVMVNILPDETIGVRWENSKSEQAALERHRNRKFLLYVPDIQASERATAALEVPLNLDKNLVGSARIALTSKKLYNWREFSKEKGAAVTRNIILKIAADEIRLGNKPKLAYVAKDVFLDGVTPGNVDTLLRLRLLRGY